MKKSCLIVLIMFVSLAACGGGGASTVRASVEWPADLKMLSPEKLSISGTLMNLSGDGLYDDAVSGPTLSVFDGERYSIEFDGAGDGQFLLVAEIVTDGIPIGKAHAMVAISGGSAGVDIKESDFVDIGGGDMDGDGASNLMELQWGTNPSMSDLPDMDGDGVADLLDDDMDGDGLGNEEEAGLGTDPSSRDSDGDQRIDSSDNCPIYANGDQKDSDADGIGDACSADNDGDGLNDDMEAVKDTDPERPDTDGDGRIDGADLFPLDPNDWADGDKDGTGDNSDNCPHLANRDQKNTDQTCFKKGYQAEPDDLGDLCDPDPEGDGDPYVFLDSRNGSDTDECAGIRDVPFRSMKKAVEAGRARGEGIKAAAGEYDLAGVDLAGAELKGGYPANFNEAGRTFYSDDQSELAVLFNTSSEVTLVLEDIQEEVAIEGFMIANNRADTFVDTVRISGSKAVLRKNYIKGGPLSPNARAMVIDSNSSVILDANRIDGGATQTGVSSVAVSVDNADVTMTNNILIGGSARHATGSEFKNADPVLANNTIDAGSHASSPQVSLGVILQDSSPRMVDNLIFADHSGDQTLIWCQEGDIAGAIFKNNMLATFPQAKPNFYWIDCYGNRSRSVNKSLDGATVSGNIDYAGEIGGMISGSYHLIGTGKDAGINTNTSEYGDVTKDHYGTSRPLNKYDIGAVEN